MNGSGSSLICADVVDAGRYGAGRGGTGGTDSRLPKGVAGLNQYDDLGAIDGYDAVTGWGSIRALALEGARECVLCVENENAEMLSQRELAREVIHDEPSLSASISSVAKLGRGFSSIAAFAGGHGSRMSSSAARLRLMMTSVPTRQPNARLLSNATVEEYATSPMNRL